MNTLRSESVLPSKGSWFSIGNGRNVLFQVVVVGGGSLPQMEEFKYLGILLRSDCRIKREVEDRLSPRPQ